MFYLGSVLEVALTGTALPVLVSVSPQTKFQFGDSAVGEHSDMQCTLRNDCHTLPVSYQFRRIAHFLAKPANGKIRPQQSQDVLLSFSPNQIGTFTSIQYIDVVGPVADIRNPFVIHQQVIHSVPVKVSGKADPSVVKKQPVYNPGNFFYPHIYIFYKQEHICIFTPIYPIFFSSFSQA